MDVSQPLTFVGNKYTQNYGTFSTHNVECDNGTGYRMEDYGISRESLNSTLNRHVACIVVADGHGSIPVFSRTSKKKHAERWIGGYEIAYYATKITMEYMKHCGHVVDFSTLSKEGFCLLLKDAFEFVQHKCLEQIYSGAIVNHEGDRLQDLRDSDIDGEHFATTIKNDTRFLVQDKILLPYKNNPLCYYTDHQYNRVLAEYGTTLTAVFIVPQGESLKMYVSHAGDSDVYLFYKINNHYEYTKITLDHSVDNEEECIRIKEHGMSVDGRYFSLQNGPERGRGIMPSRSMGHCLLSQHGITSEPSTLFCNVFKGDIVIVATDGLWSSYGDSCSLSKSNFATTKEDRSAFAVARDLDSVGNSSSTAIAQYILKNVQSKKSRQDNVCLVVTKI